MINKLNWYIEDKTIFLEGELDKNNLLPLWKIYKILFINIKTLDISNLYKVDSAGLALIIHILYYFYQLKKPLILTGITDQCNTLIDLYRLKNIIDTFGVIIN